MPEKPFDWHSGTLTPHTRITHDYRTTQNVRRYVHCHVPGFTFSRPFMAWIRANEGITMADLVAQAHKHAERK